jgi:hypothetical protein
MSRQGSRGILLVGTAVSLAVHAGLGAGFVRLGAAQPATGDDGEGLSRVEVVLIPDMPPELDPEPPRPLQLGLEQGSPESNAWLGFEDQTEHLAPQGAIDQSAMTLAESDDQGVSDSAAAPPGPLAESEQTPNSMPVPAPVETAESAPPEPVFPPDVPQTEPPRESEVLEVVTEPAEFGNVEPVTAEFVEAAQWVTEAVRLAVNLAADAATELARRVEPLTTQVEPPTAPPRESRESPPEPPPIAPESPAPGAGGAGGAQAPGITSDRESIAAAVRDAPTVRPGRVLAAQGLEIQTRTPRWTYTTMMTRRPRNPTVEIAFGADGRVRHADFVRDGAKVFNTGFEDVDEPLLSAIYTWTAKGKPISDLAGKAGVPTGGGPAAKESASEVRILITIIFS